jgi:hypothetical protein
VKKCRASGDPFKTIDPVQRLSVLVRGPSVRWHTLNSEFGVFDRA